MGSRLEEGCVSESRGSREQAGCSALEKRISLGSSLRGTGEMRQVVTENGRGPGD